MKSLEKMAKECEDLRKQGEAIRADQAQLKADLARLMPKPVSRWRGLVDRAKAALAAV